MPDNRLEDVSNAQLVNVYQSSFEISVNKVIVWLRKYCTNKPKQHYFELFSHRRYLGKCYSRLQADFYLQSRVLKKLTIFQRAVLQTVLRQKVVSFDSCKDYESRHPRL